MVRRTWGEVKETLARVAGQAGMSIADARLLANLNVMTEELMNELDTPSIIDRLDFKVTGGTITLPQAYERVFSMNLNGVPQTLQSPWFEFVGYGPDLITGVPASQLNGQWEYLNQLNGVLDRDDVCLFKDIPPTALGTYYKLMIATTTDERVAGVQPGDVIVEGLDGNGDIIRSIDDSGNWINGVAFKFAQGGVFQQAAALQVYSQVTRVLKPLTKQPLDCYMIPVSGSGQGYTQIGRWEAQTTCPALRRYRINGLNCETEYCIKARLRRRFFTVRNDNDFLLISNLPALKAMIQAVNYSESEDPEKYAVYKAIATDILKKECKAYIGLQRQKPLITFGEGLGVRQDGMYIV